MKKIVTVIGSRPQYVKAVLVSRHLAANGVNESIIHTWQHYDYEMTNRVIEGLKVETAEKYRGLLSRKKSQDRKKVIEMKETARCTEIREMAHYLQRIGKILKKKKPDCVLIYGDTNSTLAGALAGAKSGIPVAHVEAGMRSFDRSMPEEINRVVSDHLSSIFFCSSGVPVRNLEREGIENGGTHKVYNVGDVMIDMLEEYSVNADRSSGILKETGIESKKYYLLTVHRAANTDNVENLKNILEAVSGLDSVVVFPVHPRTQKVIEAK